MWKTALNLSPNFVPGATDTALIAAPGSGPPAIAQPLVSLTVNKGQAATFSVAATGNYLGYRWQFGNNWLAGATNATLVLNNVTPANAGDYRAEVSNLAGIVLSAEVNLTVIVPPTITEQPVSQNVRAGSSFSLSVRLSGPAPFIYQWLKGGQPVSGATSEPAVVAVMARPLSRLERRPPPRGTLNPGCSPRRWMARR